MILSVSRRTDIPNYYSEWFMNRLKDGFLCVRNPMNPHQVSKIELSPELVDCIVFWTKNPKPMFTRLDELNPYKYYFQFTLTGYGKDIEPNVPHKKHEMISIFKELSLRIGKEKVVWRYDPIFFTEKYTQEYHVRAFEAIAKELNCYTDKVVISFLDIYRKTKKNMYGISLIQKEQDELRAFASKLAKIASENHMKIATCAEQIDLSECGIEHNSCIDRELIERVIGCKINAKKDKNQRDECGCVESIEVGAYDTCLNGCKYCYANFSDEIVRKKCKQYNPNSPILLDNITEEDKVTMKKMKSVRQEQIELNFTL